MPLHLHKDAYKYKYICMCIVQCMYVCTRTCVCLCVCKYKENQQFSGNCQMQRKYLFNTESPSTRISRSARILKHSTFWWHSAEFGGVRRCSVVVVFNLMHDAARPNRQMFISPYIYRTVWGHHQATIKCIQYVRQFFWLHSKHWENAADFMWKTLFQKSTLRISFYEYIILKTLGISRMSVIFVYK